MKNFFIKFFLFFLLIVIIWFLTGNRLLSLKNKQLIFLNSKKQKSQFHDSPTGLPSITPVKHKITKKSQAIFLTDWMITNQDKIDLSGYCPIIFFGESERFNKEQIKNEKCQNFFYTVKITNADFAVRNDFFDEIKNEGFNGVVADLEIAGISSDNLVEKINNLVDGLGKRAKEANLKFLLAVYGDTFYRHRPYDIDFFAKNSDGIMIMAYDFSKSYGEPGPNFPYSGREKYGYDFQQMISDFLRFVPEEKLTVIFGMYGYDWMVDEKKRPISQAKAITLAEIRNKFFGERRAYGKEFECQLNNCIFRRDPLAKEVEINYTIAAERPDEQGIYRIDYHIVWYEDEESVATKIKFLEEKGIGSIAYWAYKYF
jgi:hypothetical protein